MKYRKLGIGEVIQERDEFFNVGKWEVTRLAGELVPDLIVGQYRRPLTPEETANIFRERLADLMEEFGVSVICEDLFGSIWAEFDIEISPVVLARDGLTPESLRESLTSPETGATETE